MMDVALAVFWISAAGIVYIFAGYPLLIAVAGRLWPMRRTRSPHAGTVSMVLSVYNEAHQLPTKLSNLLSLDGADQIVEILIGSDGSTDGTAEVVASFPDPRVRAIAYTKRRGKPAVLNDLIPQCRGDYVLLTDARQEFAANFLTECLANFADDSVGVVSGELVFRTAATTTTAAEGIGLYWRYEKFLRRSESQFRGVPGATGACYAVRRDLFQPIDPTTLLDDVAIPMRIVAQGKRCVFEPRAIAYDNPSQSPTQEAIRKRRTIAGAAQLVTLYPSWLLPWRNPLWLEFVSHKLLRLASPVLLVLALVSNSVLVAVPPYAVLLSVQLCFYLAALTGWWFQQRGQKSRCFGPALMFLTLNLTTAAALVDALRSRYQVTWKRATA